MKVSCRATAVLDHQALKAAGVARGGKDGVRLLGKGTLSAKLQLRVAGASRGAVEAVEKAGGSVEVLASKRDADTAEAAQ
jgi:large subunit ribosomal protein L15